ncbi:unnamed protein product [Rotaria sordida]|uniref:Nudix hydrolase domain-containing protein n=1 Tax=Rotaria sordida TaxID=392033 RepID=A0A819QGS1_9BILA|nr:unnamed protein product [Rotaria sordida]CAF4030669.1 unnamed protein product [Rotaria sordida]
MIAEDMKQYAIPNILETLDGLRKNENENNLSNETSGNKDGGDWREKRPNNSKIAKSIWNIWHNEREKCPRAGIILVFRETLSKIRVLLTKYDKNNCTQYGFPKGKIEFGETIWECAAREDIEWRSIYQLPCCKRCRVVDLIESVDVSKESNYFMVMCRDSDNRTSLVQYIAYWLYAENSQRSIGLLTYISEEKVYKRILEELFTIDYRFYGDFDARKLTRQPNKIDWKDFAIPVILKMLDIIYQQWVSDLSSDDESMNNKYSESSDTVTTHELITPEIARIHTRCANYIWREWCHERRWGPRVGVILISTMEEGAEKILVISHISDKPTKRLNIGFPKGKPNLGETIREGSVREFVEEIGMNDPYDILKTAILNGAVITKYPHIGSIQQRRSRTHHYVLATTTSQDKSFRPNKKEVDSVEWHSIYTLPCCDTCKKNWSHTLPNGSKIPVNYHMVTLRDINGTNSAVLDILAYIDAKNDNRNAYHKYVYTHRECRNNFEEYF